MTLQRLGFDGVCPENVWRLLLFSRIVRGVKRLGRSRWRMLGVVEGLLRYVERMFGDRSCFPELFEE